MNRPRIAVVGSLNMDLVVSMKRMPKPGETVPGEHIRYIPGGKGANQAVGCARLGAEVAMIGAVGDDLSGRQILDEMVRSGVSAAHIRQLEGVPTGIASIFHTPDDNCIAVVPGANGRCDPGHVDASADAIRGADLLLAQLEIPLSTVEHALRLARSAGVRTVLNPAPAQTLPESLLRLADVLTPDESEFEALTGTPCDSEDELAKRMAEWQAAYGHAKIVTRGKRGASYLRDGRLHTVPAPAVRAVDTTGAGDAFNAALGFGLASGWQTDRAVSFAVRAASLSVTRFGAQGGMPTYAEVEAMG